MYERRLKIFLILIAVMVISAVARLWQMQLANADSYRHQVEDMYSVELLPSIRGQILDRAGRLLAVDQATYDFCLDYRMLTQTPTDQGRQPKWVGERIAEIAKELGISPEQAKDVYRQRVERTWELAQECAHVSRNELAQAADKVVRRIATIREIRLSRYGTVGLLKEETTPHPIVRSLDDESANALRSHLGEMVGASIQPSHGRNYPYADAACHIIGVMGEVTEAERDEQNILMDADEPLLLGYLADDEIGKTGVEKAGERILRGSRGLRKIHRTGKVIEEIPAVFGQDVHLTLDIELQRELSGLIKIPSAIVVIDIASGEVLAMTSLPTYDLNQYHKIAADLAGEKATLPLWNRCVQVRYPPGSTFKPLTALAGLASGAIDVNTAFFCQGFLHKPGEFGCLGHHGDLTLLTALEKSCNVFFYNVGERVGIRRMETWATTFGFADRPGTLLPEDRPGLLAGPHAQGVGEARYMGIGQGQLMVTPVHVANFMAAVARGQFRSPVVIREFADRQVTRELGIATAALDTVRKGMYMVVNSPGGTAYKYGRDPEIEICGKTGTAETPARKVDADNDGSFDTVLHGDTAWFAGYAPYNNPRIAFAVMIEYTDEHGGVICGPIGRQVVQLCRKHGYLD
jgi:penicillin-binding protein 2